MKTNPFLTKGYISPEYFCNRANETNKIISAIKNNRDLTLISLRRMGKTGLIHHVFYQNEIKSTFNLIYCDIYQATNLAEMTQILGSAVFNQLEKTTDRMLKKFKRFFSGIAPSLSINPITLQADIDFRIENIKQAEMTIQQIFLMINKSGKPTVLVFDEFQQIEKFPETLQERVPGIDPVIVRFISEAIISVKAGSNLGCAFLLGVGKRAGVFAIHRTTEEHYLQRRIIGVVGFNNYLALKVALFSRLKTHAEFRRRVLVN